MINSEIIKAAVKAEAEKRHAIDADLVVIALAGAEVRVVGGEPVLSDVKDAVAKIVREKPHLFRMPDAAKMTDAEFGTLEAELREPQQPEPVSMPGWIREIDAADLTETESLALRSLLCGSRNSYARSICESAARRQGIDTTLAAA